MNLALIQARIGSSRLPSKILKNLGSKTVLEHVVERVKRAKLVDEVVVVTTIEKQDLEVVRYCSENSIRVFVGSEDDVLDRYYQAAKLFKPDNVIRITSDCPLMDPNVIDMVVKAHLGKESDYTSNTLDETFPDGEDVEVFTFNSLERAWNDATLQSEREHVTPYIKTNPELFKLQSIKNDENLSDKRWTIDNQEDYDFLEKIFYSLESENEFFGMDEVLNLLKSNPEWEGINSHIVRNEGYLKSLKNDKRM